MFDQIEKLKSEYTDKYVVVDDSIPELMRFDGHVGQIKTVNMNGRALVQFDTWNNIGWYDIEIACLKVVPKPDPAAAEAKAKDAKKDVPRPVKQVAAGSAPTTGEKKLSPLEMARQQGAAKPAGGAAAGGAKKSTADILAAARANKGAAPAAPADKPAAGGKMSTADILAAARAKKAAEAVPVAAEQETTEAVAEAAPAAKPAAKSAGTTTLPAGQRPTVPQILAWCREHDTK